MYEELTEEEIGCIMNAEGHRFKRSEDKLTKEDHDADYRLKIKGNWDEGYWD